MDSFNMTFDELDALLSISEFEELPRVGQPVAGPSSGVGTTAKSRFEPVNESDVLSFIQQQQNDNTRKKTESDMKLFVEFCAAQNETRATETLAPAELDKLFGNFIANVKKADGTEYEPSTIRGFMSSLDRHLKNKNYNHRVNKGEFFPHSNNAMKAKLTYLKSQGLGNKPHESDELTDEDIDKLFEAEQLGHETPQQTVNLLHLSFSLVFGMRGGLEQRNLKWGDIDLNVDEAGDQYLCFSKERQTKTRPGSDPKNTRKFKPKIFAHADKQRCPIGWH